MTNYSERQESYTKKVAHKLTINEETLNIVKKALSFYRKAIFMEEDCFTSLQPELNNEDKERVLNLTKVIFSIYNDFQSKPFRKDILEIWEDIFNNLDKKEDGIYEKNINISSIDRSYLGNIFELYMRMFLGDYSDLNFLLSNVFIFDNTYDYIAIYLQELRSILLPKSVKEIGNDLHAHYGIMNTSVPEEITFIVYPLWQITMERDIWQQVSKSFMFNLEKIGE